VLLSYDRENSSFYLYNGKTFWTMTPYSLDNATIFVLSPEKLSFMGIDKFTNFAYLRPVINLRSDIKITGKGTADYPYIVS